MSQSAKRMLRATAAGKAVRGEPSKPAPQWSDALPAHTMMASRSSAAKVDSPKRISPRKAAPLAETPITSSLLVRRFTHYGMRA